MARAGILLNATAPEFVTWFEAWSQRPDQPAYEVVQGQVKPAKAEQQIVLSQHLTLEVPGALLGAPDVPVAIPSLFTFQVLPVGLGTSVVILGTSNLPEPESYLAEFVSAAGLRWPGAERTAWFGAPPNRSVELCTFTVSARTPALEEVLSRFAASYATSPIRSVSFFPIAEARTLHSRKLWEFRLSLCTVGPWQGIDHTRLDCQVLSTPGSHSLQVTLGCQGFVHRETEQFASALVAYCQTQWADTRMSYTATLHQTATPNPPANPGRLLPPFDQRGWTVIDPPWELIADTGWDRRLLELWWRNYPSKAIGRHLGVSSKRVLNRISELRRIHGSGIVPTEMQRRGKNQEEMGYLGS